MNTTTTQQLQLQIRQAELALQQFSTEPQMVAAFKVILDDLHLQLKGVQ